MRTVLPKATLIFSLLSPIAVSAAPLAESSIGVFASYWDTADADETFGAGVKFKMGIVELRGSYFEDVTADTSPQATDLEVQAIPIDLGITFNFAPDFPLNPYIGGGGSYYILDTNFGEMDDEFGWYALVGGELGVPAGFSVMAEIQYRGIEGTVTTDTGLATTTDVDLDLSGASANLGLAWRF